MGGLEHTVRGIYYGVRTHVIFDIFVGWLKKGDIGLYITFKEEWNQICKFLNYAPPLETDRCVDI